MYATPAELKHKLCTLVLFAERAVAAAATVSTVASDAVPSVAPSPAAAVPPAFSSPYSRVLLGMKKRGFGAGKWNGFGGKIELGETLRAAAVREFGELACVDLDPSWLSKRAVLVWQFEHDPVVVETHVYVAELPSAASAASAVAAACAPKETEEMRPQWFDVVRRNVGRQRTVVPAAAGRRGAPLSSALPVPRT